MTIEFIQCLLREYKVMFNKEFPLEEIIGSDQKELANKVFTCILTELPYKQMSEYFSQVDRMIKDNISDEVIVVDKSFWEEEE